MQDNLAYLMHVDIPTATVKLINNGSSVQLVDVINPEHMPIGTYNVHPATRNARFARWQQSRCIPKERPNLNKILAHAGVSNASELSFKNYSASLTDGYWYKPINSDDTFKDISYIINGFSSNIGNIIMTGDITEITSFDSPDTTTDGCLPKMWYMNENKNFFMLKGNDLENNAGQPVNAVGEVFASKVATSLDLYHVDYSFAKLSGHSELLSICPSFIKNHNFEFVPFKQYAHELPVILRGGLKGFVSDAGLKKDTDNTLLFDYVVGNTDRHAGNIGVLRDVNSLRVIGLAPIFDSGTCMQYDFLTGKIEDSDAKLFHSTQKEELDWVTNFEVVEKLNSQKIADLYIETATEKIDDAAIEANVKRLHERIEVVKEKALAQTKTFSVSRDFDIER